MTSSAAPARDIYLIADDAVPILRLMKWKIQTAFGKDTDVRLAEDGEEAVQIFDRIVKDGRHNDLVAVIVDYHMPKCSGVESMQMMREIERRHQLPRAVDIIGFSADESDEMNQLMLDGGANRVVSKPPDPGELEKACEDIKEKRRGLLSVAV